MTSSLPSPSGVPIGEQLGFLEYQVTDENLHMFQQAVGYPASYFPNLAAMDHFFVLLQKRNFPVLESVTHEDRYFRPPVTGRRVQVTGWIQDQRISRGVETLTVETFAVDEIGTEILRSQHVFRLGAGRAPERLGRRPGSTRGAENTTFLPSLVKRVTEEAIEQLEAARRSLVGEQADLARDLRSNVHASADLASGMGLASTVAPEEMGLAYLHELLDRRYGIDFRQGGWLKVNYRRPMYAGDTLTAKGTIARTESDGTRATSFLQVWLENGRGEMVITGEARVTVPSPLT